MRIFSIIGAAFCLLATAAAAGATPITETFTVTATGGPLAGTSSTGTFTFDSSIIPSGGGLVNGTGLLTDLSFDWNGTAFDETTAHTGSLSFHADGTFPRLCLGRTAIPPAVVS
jgi:hypothetical protein